LEHLKTIASPSSSQTRTSALSFLLTSALTIVVALATVLAPAPCLAQNIRDSRGTDFWLTFLPNDRELNNSDPSLHLFITAQMPTNGEVLAVRRNGSTLRIPFTIALANDTVSLELDPRDHELQGSNYPTTNTRDAERSVNIAVHITGTEELSVYAVTRERYTTDAWLVLPTDALGTEYRVMSYPSYAYTYVDFRGRGSVTEGFPSQFVVIATANDTRVDIDLAPGRSSVSSLPRRTVILQRGDAYLVQTAITYEQPNDDFTGSLIRATKPVAVVGGHFRAQVPVRNGSSASRDFLVEQVPSVDTWGKQCVVVTPQAPADVTSYGSWDYALCRILASTDNTVVNANGTIQTLMAGGFMEVPLTEPILVSASNPVLCAILARSSNRGGGNSRSGDPFLLVVPPPEQFQDSYTVISVQPNRNASSADEHWITLIAPVSSQPSLFIDGIMAPVLTVIPGTLLGYVHIKVSSGTHRATCDSTFGIYVYGYRQAESYGYTGGMSFQRLFAPTIHLRVHDMQAKPGKLDTMIVTVDSISDTASFSAYGASLLNFDMSWNVSMFVPRNSGNVSISGVTGATSTVFSFDSLNVGDTILSVAGYHALGTAETDSIRLTSPLWRSSNTDTVNIFTIIRNGTISTDGICREGGRRLFDPTAGRPSASITYNDHGDVFLTPSQSFATAYTVDVFDALGRLVQKCLVPANTITPLPLASAPYEPLFVRP